MTPTHRGLVHPSRPPAARPASPARPPTGGGRKRSRPTVPTTVLSRRTDAPRLMASKHPADPSPLPPPSRETPPRPIHRRERSSGIRKPTGVFGSIFRRKHDGVLAHH